jgi:hypothetical protein
VHPALFSECLDILKYILSTVGACTHTSQNGFPKTELLHLHASGCITTSPVSSNLQSFRCDKSGVVNSTIWLYRTTTAV